MNEATPNPDYYGQQGAPVQEQPVDYGQPMQAPAQEIPFGTVEGILSAPDITTDDMYIPEWKCMIRVTGLSKQQQHGIRAEASRGQKNQEPNAEKVEMLMFLTGVVEPKFGREHYPSLLTKNTGVIDRIIQKIAALSGTDAEAIERAKAQFQER